MELTAEDRLDIFQLLASTAQDLDLGHIGSFVSNWVADGTFEVTGLGFDADHAGVTQGTEGLTHLATTLYQGNQEAGRHWNGLPVITVDGDTVRVTSYFIVVRTGEVPRAGLLLTGVYHDVVTRTDDGWRFAARVCSIDPQRYDLAEPTDVLVMRRDRLSAAAGK